MELLLICQEDLRKNGKLMGFNGIIGGFKEELYVNGV